jgi:hypothetical protein
MLAAVRGPPVRETKKERDPFERELIALLFISRSGE